MTPSRPQSPTTPRVLSEHMRYLGVLGLLCELSVYVPDEERESIDDALADAAAGDPHLRVRRILNRREIEVVP